MTLAIGDHVVKLDRNTGKPVEGEMHVEFEVIELGQYNYPVPGDYTQIEQTVKLRKVR